MEWIELYVAEVGRHLPLKNRADIEAELRSILQDMLDEHSKKTGRPVDEAMTLDVLKEYGNPQKVAAAYMPERYLIGPSLFPTFILVGKIVLSVMVALALISLFINLAQSATTAATGVVIVENAIGNFISSVFTSLASITLIFGLIEWSVRRSGERIKMHTLPELRQWDPRQLVKTRPTNRIRYGDIITEVVFTFFAIFIFNFYPQALSVGSTTGGGWYIGTGNWTSTPLLSQAFFHYVPLLTALWGINVLLDCFLLFWGAWNTPTRLVGIGLKVANVVIAIAMLNGPSLLTLTGGILPAGLTNAFAVEFISKILPVIVQVGLWMAVVFGIVDIIRRTVEMVKAWF